MGIQFLKYLSQILQLFSLVFWSGNLVMIVFILSRQFKPNNNEKEFNHNFLFETLHKLEYIFIFAVIFLWSGILIHLTISPNNPLKSKLYILYILLAILMSIIVLIKIFWIQQVIVNSEKRLKMFPNMELQNFLQNKINNYKRAYYFLSILNLLILVIVILLNQIRG